MLSLAYVVVSSVVQYVHSELGPVHPFRKVAVRRADQACCGGLLIRAVETLAWFDIFELARRDLPGLWQLERS
jgi:hypothetical protein